MPVMKDGPENRSLKILFAIIDRISIIRVDLWPFGGSTGTKSTRKEVGAPRRATGNYLRFKQVLVRFGFFLSGTE